MPKVLEDLPALMSVSTGEVRKALNTGARRNKRGAV